jgi:dTDP-4-dehydrorhamnose reductase
MRAIRQINPRARLVQTEDLAKAHSTPSLAYQARHENARRWLTLDLPTGRVAAGHPLWSYLARAGLCRELEELASDPCLPDIVGLDYYPPSERFLDDPSRALSGADAHQQRARPLRGPGRGTGPSRRSHWL